jgi:hypothetical protein
MKLSYPALSSVVATPTSSSVKLSLEAARTVGFTGRVTDAELFRDAWLTAVAVRDSDLRYKGKDRAAYLAYLMSKGKKATKAIWEAQKAFLDSAYADDTPRQRGLDPILTVDPDSISVEVFSKDESAYARLSFDNAMFENRTAAHGTTFADLSPALAEQIERVRTYQPLDIEAHAGKGEEREIELPDDWLRGFLQVQSAATLPGTVLELAPVDFYSILFTLRTRKAKKPPRAVRFELVPGARPRIVLEPWEIAIDSHAAPYAGKTPRIVRLYGRARLAVLARALPHLKKVRVHLMGAGLPSFWVLDMGMARLTMALTSWAESKWGSAASFDALMPDASKSKGPDNVVALLRKNGPMTLEAIAKQETDARASLQRASLRGQVLFDLDRQVYRPRALLADAIDETRIRYGSPREAAAHRLLDMPGSVQVTKVHVIAGEGVELHGAVTDKAARRSFAPRFTADIEGQVRDAWCNCPTYQRSAMREGPCEHMIALFVFHRRAAAEAERLRQTPEGRKLVRAETRTLVRRDASGAQVSYRLTLDDRAVRVEKNEAPAGRPLGESRFQRLWFDTDAEARDAYFARLDGLANEGFIDTDALSA